MSSVVGAFALGLATSFIDQLFGLSDVARQLHDKAFGNTQTRRLRELYSAALANAIYTAAPHLGEPQLGDLFGVLREVLSRHPGLAGALLDLAVGLDAPNLPQMAAALDTAAFRVYGLEATAFLGSLIDSLEAALTAETSRAESPLFNYVSTMRTYEILRLLRDKDLVRSPFRAPDSSPKVFVSYARSDGGTFARRWRHELQALGYNVWQDVISQNAGDDWWRQIAQAIEGADKIVLVVTPRAFESDAVRREYSYALRLGADLLPVTPNSEVFAHTPAWFNELRPHVHVLDESSSDYKDIVQNLHRQLRLPHTRQPRPFMPRTLEPAPTARHDHQQWLLDHLLLDGIAPVSGKFALVGGPGFGKTTLALALCHDPAIVQAYSGGVLWVTLGETRPDILALLSGIHEALTGAPREFRSEENAARVVRDLLDQRRCLLVLDDVWSAAHVEPFIESTACAYLVTTRFDQVGQDLHNARQRLVEEMLPQEAEAMLASYLRGVTVQICADELGEMS